MSFKRITNKTMSVKTNTNNTMKKYLFFLTVIILCSIGCTSDTTDNSEDYKSSYTQIDFEK